MCCPPVAIPILPERGFEYCENLGLKVLDGGCVTTVLPFWPNLSLDLRVGDKILGIRLGPFFGVGKG